MNERSRRAVEKIILHANKSIAYTKFQGDGIWWKDDMILEAIVFNLAQIGELVRFVEESVQIEFSHINWSAMRGLRNRIIHDYDFIQPNMIKATIERDLPILVNDLNLILKR